MADAGEVDPEAEIYTTVPLAGIVLSKISWNPNTDCAHCGIQNRKPRDLRPFKLYGKEARVCRADDECAHRWRKREEFREANRRQQIAEEAEIAYRRTGDWYLYVYNMSDRYEVPDQAIVYERREDVRKPKKIVEIQCGYVPDGRKIVEAYNKMTKRLRELEGKT